MPTITLEDIWFHLASDLSVYVTTPLDSMTEIPSEDGEVRQYGDRFRYVSQPGTMRAFDIRLDLVERAVVDQLRAWVGVTVMVRDPLGRDPIWGVYSRPQITEITGPDRASVSLTLVEVTASAEV